MITRRKILAGAGAIIAAGAVAHGRGGIGGLPVWRGNGQNMRNSIIGFAGGSNWSSCYRSRHYSNVAFRYARFVIPTFWSTGSPIVDTDLPNSYTFQLGVEYPFTPAFTGIAARIPVTFNTANTVSYTGTGPKGYILSDVIDFGAVVPAGTFFGLWTTVENAVGASSASNSLPYQSSASNNYQSGWQRYTGNIQAASSLISAGTALSASFITTVGTTQSGASFCVFTPCMMLIQCASQSRSIIGLGDSILDGVDEGATVSGISGDVLGSALGNAGCIARWVNETLNYNFVNLGRPSDRFSYFSATNFKYRLQLIALCNPSHVISQAAVNDISFGASLPTLLANAKLFYAAVNVITGSVPIIQACCTPNSASTDSWSTTANQIANTGFGSSSSVRGQWNDTYVRTGGSSLGNAGAIDPNPGLEFGYIEGSPSSETSLWNVNGSANAYTDDGVHPNSFGAAQAVANMIAFRNGSQVTDPFAN